MLSPDSHSSELFSECSGHKSRIVEESPNVSFISCIENNWTICLIEVGLVNQVSHLVCLSSCSMVIEVVDRSTKVFLLRLEISISSDSIFDTLHVLLLFPDHFLMNSASWSMH